MNTSSSEGSPRVQRCAPSAFLAAAIAASSARLSRPETCSSVPNGATMSMPSQTLKLGGEPVQIGAGDDPGVQARLRDHLARRAARQQLAVGDIGDLVAALGLVHVVGGDQHGDALGGEPVDLVPELAPRLGIDAGGRLVEQQQPRLRQDAGAERQPLLPAARQLAGELVLRAGEPKPGDGLASPPARGSGTP